MTGALAVTPRRTVPTLDPCTPLKPSQWPLSRSLALSAFAAGVCVESVERRSELPFFLPTASAHQYPTHLIRKLSLHAPPHSAAREHCRASHTTRLSSMSPC